MLFQLSKNILGINYFSIQQMLLTWEPTRAGNSRMACVCSDLRKKKKKKDRAKSKIMDLLQVERKLTTILEFGLSCNFHSIHSLMYLLALFQVKDTWPSVSYLSFSSYLRPLCPTWRQWNHCFGKWWNCIRSPHGNGLFTSVNGCEESTRTTIRSSLPMKHKPLAKLYA